MFPILTITSALSADQFVQIDVLWNEVYPKNLNNRFGKLLEGINNYNHHLLVAHDQVIAWAVIFLRDKEFWFSILVHPAHQGKGYGRLLINSLKYENNSLNAWVIDHDRDLKRNGERYISPMPFYIKMGFKIISEDRIETDVLSAVKIKTTR